MVRRSLAAGAGLLVVLLLGFAFKGCLDSRKEGAFRDYVGEARAFVEESRQQSAALFELLGNAGDIGDVDVENRLNGLRVASEELVDRAAGTDHPDELEATQGYLVETLRFRRDGIQVIANELPNVLADAGDRREGTEAIANSMLYFAASDVLYQTRFEERLRSALSAEELGEENVPTSAFLPERDYLRPDFVADQIGGRGGGSRDDAEAAPGLHGNGLTGVTLGGQALAEGGSASITLGDDLAFEVQVANQGENTETDVQVRVSVGEGGDAIELDGVLDEIAAGETKPVTIPLSGEPPTGQNVPIAVEIEPVPGEEMTDNNSGDFSAIFTR